MQKCKKKSSFNVNRFHRPNAPFSRNVIRNNKTHTVSSHKRICLVCKKQYKHKHLFICFVCCHCHYHLLKYFKAAAHCWVTEWTDIQEKIMTTTRALLLFDKWLRSISISSIKLRLFKLSYWKQNCCIWNHTNPAQQRDTPLWKTIPNKPTDRHNLAVNWWDHRHGRLLVPSWSFTKVALGCCHQA